MTKSIALIRPRTLAFLAAVALSSTTISQAADLIWHWQGTPPSSSIRTQIEQSMYAARMNFNNISQHKYGGDIAVNYNAGVPTAQVAGWKGLMTFGGSRNTRVAQHEISHWLVVGTYQPAWNQRRSGNNWTGSHGLAQVRAFDGSSAMLFSDGTHMWPYGLNYDNEWNSTTANRNVYMVGATRWDVGLSHFP
jgi:hypothetical protein